jgi:hypothetical protein
MLHVLVTSSHYQPDNSGHGYDMFSANVNNMESHTVALNMLCPYTEMSV